MALGWHCAEVPEGQLRRRAYGIPSCACREAGGEVPEWMLALKKTRTKERRRKGRLPDQVGDPGGATVIRFTHAACWGARANTAERWLRRHVSSRRWASAATTTAALAQGREASTPARGRPSGRGWRHSSSSSGIRLGRPRSGGRTAAATRGAGAEGAARLGRARSSSGQGRRLERWWCAWRKPLQARLSS